jgi:hypothetical protein
MFPLHVVRRHNREKEMAMTIIELLDDSRVGKPEKVSFGYFLPTVDGERVDDPPEIATALEQAGDWRVMPWSCALEALVALGSRRAAPIVVHTSRGIATFRHDGAGWQMLGSPQVARGRRRPNPC